MQGLPQKQNARRAYKIRLCGHLRRYKKIVKKTYIICNNYNIFFQNRILEDIMKNKRVYSNIRRVCYLVWGTFAVNWFSIQRCRNLKKF